MPHEVKKSGSGYKVVKKTTGKAFSKHSMPKARAMAQMRAIQMKSHRGK